MKIQHLVILLAFSVFLVSCKNSDKNSKAASNKVSSAKIFELLSPNKTGIDFSNNMVYTKDINYFTYENLYNGGGVAIGDINNDGLSDIFFNGNMVFNKLYLNKGNLQFEDISANSGLNVNMGFKSGISMSDINADGWLDIIICHTALSDAKYRINKYYINNKNLSFTDVTESIGIVDSAYSNQCYVFDLDSDNDLDVYNLNTPFNMKDSRTVTLIDSYGTIVKAKDIFLENETDKLYLKNESNTFSRVSGNMQPLNNGFGLSASIADFDHDNNLDIYVANDFLEPDYLYSLKGNELKNIAKDYFKHYSESSMGSDVADINNDGHLDLFSSDMFSDENYRQKVLKGSVSFESFLLQVKYGFEYQYKHNCLQIFNGKKYSDVAFASGVANTDWTWAPLFADFDNDGWKDIFITNGYRIDITNNDYLKFTVDSVGRKLKMTAIDLMRDLFPLIPKTPLRNYAYKNMGQLQFNDYSTVWGINELSFSNGAAYADLDNDGDLEIVVNNLDSTAFVYKNNSVELGLGNHLTIGFEGPKGNSFGVGAMAKITQSNGSIQVAQLMPTRGFLSSVEPYLHFGLGKETNVTLEVFWQDGKYQKIDNVAANTRNTVRYSDARETKRYYNNQDKTNFSFTMKGNLGLDYIQKENEYIDFKTEPLLHRMYSMEGPYSTQGDINGDGLADLIISGAKGYTTNVYLQKTDGTFKKQIQPNLSADSLYEDAGLVLVDIDNDNDLDLYIASGGNESPNQSPSYQDRIYINDGKGNFTKNSQLLPNENNSGSIVKPIDYDQDGDIDLLVGGMVSPGQYPSPPKTMLLQNNQGVYADATATIAPDLAQVGMIHDAQWKDVNQDSLPDLIVVGEWMPLTFFINKKTSFEKLIPKSLEKSNGWWKSVALEDIDKDGDVDIIAGNAGVNSRLRSNEKEPLTLIWGDLDKNGSIDPVLGYYNQNKCFPYFMRDQMLDQMPFLRKIYTRYTPYAKATFPEVLQGKESNATGTYYCYESQTCWYENDGNMNFTKHALPFWSQCSAVQCIYTRDFNADGKTDIMLAGNDYSPEIETGRADAGFGLILYQQADKSFKEALYPETGFYVDGDVRSMQVLGNTFIFFRNQGACEVATFNANKSL